MPQLNAVSANMRINNEDGVRVCSVANVLPTVEA